LGIARQAWPDATEAVATAYQRDPEAIEKWRRETFPPSRRARSRRRGLLLDESGFRADAVHAGLGVKGKRPSSNAQANGNRSAPHRR